MDFVLDKTQEYERELNEPGRVNKQINWDFYYLTSHDPEETKPKGNEKITNVCQGVTAKLGKSIYRNRIVHTEIDIFHQIEYGEPLKSWSLTIRMHSGGKFEYRH